MWEEKRGTKSSLLSTVIAYRDIVGGKDGKNDQYDKIDHHSPFKQVLRSLPERFLDGHRSSLST